MKMKELPVRMTSFVLLHSALLSFSIQSSSIAQSSNMEDFLLLYSGDTLYGSVQYINEKGVSPRFYKKVRLTGTQGKQKKFKRKEVAGFRMNSEVYESFWLSQSSDKILLLNPRYDIDPKRGDLYFLKRKYKGILSHYQLEWLEQGDNALMSMDLLKKADDPFFIRATQGLLGLKTNVLKVYFSDCPELKEQIEQKQMRELGQVIDFYNRNCNY